MAQHEYPRNGGNNQQHGQFTTSTSPAVAVPVCTVGARMGVTLLNIDATNTIYIGNSGVTSSNGFPLKPGASITRNYWGNIYAVAGAGTPVLAWISDEDL